MQTINRFRGRPPTAWIAAVGLLLLTGGGCVTGEEGEGGDRASAPAVPEEISRAYFAEESCCEDDTPCQDGLFCNGRETCNCWGECEPPDPTFNPCYDADPCTSDSCDELRDMCPHTPLPGPGCPCSTNADCDDSNLCTQDICDAGSARCTYNPVGCDDGDICTADACDPLGGCTHTPVPGCCRSDADCPESDPCYRGVCNTVTGVCSRAPRPLGTACASDGNACTNDICNGSGTCTHPPTPGAPCDDGLGCTTTSTCNSSGLCIGSGNPCSDGLACTGDVCTNTAGGGYSCTYPLLPGYCLIGGACYPEGAWRPGYPCQSCQPSVNPTGWTNRTAGSACPDEGLACTGDVCNSAGTCTHPITAGYCLISSVCYSNGTLSPSNPCQSCQSAVTQTAWSNLASGTACPNDGISCTLDQCNGSGTCAHPLAPNYCYIGGACYANNANNPANECQACLVATSTSAWTNRAYGTGCTADSYSCTSDICNGTGSCTHPVTTGCLISGVCYAEGTRRPSYECQGCVSATSTTAWSNLPAGTSCTPDTHTCTLDQCDGAGTCVHPISSYAANDVCNGSGISQTGSGATAYWQTTGDTYCGRDNYTSACGGDNANGDNIGPDLVHYFDISPNEFMTYRYRVQTAGPAAFNPVHYYYNGSGGCGVASQYYSCNDNDVSGGTCWGFSGALAHDGDDACQYNLWFPSGRNYVVVDSAGAGGTYTVKIDRRVANTSDCSDPPLPELQLGGTWTGNTCSPRTEDWWTNMPYCVSTTYDDAYYFNIYHINHTGTFAGLNRGYVVTLDGTFTTGGFNTSMFFAVNNCRSPWYLLSCDNDTYHYLSGAAGYGSKIVTGPVPSGWWGGIIVTSYPRATCGNYTLRVEFDQDGDGIPDGSDGSNALLRGATATIGGEGGTKQIPSWPWADHGYSYAYPNNSLPARSGVEVYYSYANPSSRSMTIRIYPRIRGDVWSGAGSYLWDGVVWMQPPVAVSVLCNGYGWYSVGAGSWFGCDMYGGGEWEEITIATAPAGTYRFAVDSYNNVPRGGWYTIEFR